LTIKKTNHTLLIDGIKDMSHAVASEAENNTSRTRSRRRQYANHFADRSGLTKLRSKSLFQHVDSTWPAKQGRGGMACQSCICRN